MDKQHREFVGWLMFLISACFFVAVGIRDSDPVVGAGSVAFLLGCLLFLLP